MLEEGVSDHRHKRMSVKALPGSSLEVVKTKFFFHLLVSLLANPTRLERALSFPFVPLRQLMVRHLVLASISSAGIDRMSGTCRRRGRPRLATGQIIRTSAGYTLRRRGIPTAQASLRAVSP